jgi:hypothetical protein
MVGMAAKYRLNDGITDTVTPQFIFAVSHHNQIQQRHRAIAAALELNGLANFLMRLDEVEWTA